MKSYPMPAQFDGAKFAARYGLDPFKKEFWSDSTNLYVPDNLPDDPPIFEAPDVVIKKTIEQRLADIEADITVLKAKVK